MADRRDAHPGDADDGNGNAGPPFGPSSQTPGALGPTQQRRLQRVIALSTAVVILSLCASCLGLPPLWPWLQVALIPPMLVAGVCGLLGGWRRSWRVAVGPIVILLAAFVVYDLLNNPYGYAALWDVYVRRRPPPPSLMYFHTWAQLWQLAVIPLMPAVALFVYGVVRSLRDSQRPQRDKCLTCGYSLRGLTAARCPECGTEFDARAVHAALKGEVDGEGP